jgi:hypothetical protein
MKQPGNSEERMGSCDPISEAEIDEALEESFPASDPLPWTRRTPGLRIARAESWYPKGRPKLFSPAQKIVHISHLQRSPNQSCSRLHAPLADDESNDSSPDGPQDENGRIGLVMIASPRLGKMPKIIPCALSPQ